jgi:hypothetical protein
VSCTKLPARSSWLAIGEPLHQLVGDLGARNHLERDPLAPQAPDDLRDVSGDLERRRLEQRVHVRRRDDRARAVGDGRPRERDALLDARGPVVDPGEQVEVQLDVPHRVS